MPLISAADGGHGLHDTTTDLDLIRAWWTANPRANIGLRTGLSFDVIDLDNEAAVDALERARGGREPLQGASTSGAEVEGAEVDIATHAGDSISEDLMTNLPRSGPEEDADRHRRRARPGPSASPPASLPG